MSWLLDVHRNRLRIAKSAEAAVLQMLKEADAKKLFYVSEDISTAETLDAAFGGMGFRLQRDDRGGIVGLSNEGNEVRAGYEEEPFRSLGPFVGADSFIDVWIPPDEGMVRYAFNGKRCLRRRLKLTDEELAGEIEATEAARKRPPPPLPTWVSLRGTMPTQRPAYLASGSFPAGSWLEHPRFGPGHVHSVAEGKMVVVFEGGERTLACSR